MKLRRIIAAASAAALAASTVAATASAITISGADAGAGGAFVVLLDEKRDDALYTDMAAASTMTKVVLTITTDSFEDVMDVKDATWMGGGIGFNSDSTGWEQHEWSFQDGVKELTWVADEKEETFTITFDKGAPIFAATDTYAHVWIQSWDSQPFDFEIVDFQLLNADGVDIRDVKVEAPVETPAETVEAPVEETVEESVEETVVVDEETVEIIETAEDVVVETVEDTVVEDTAEVETPAVDTEAPTTGDKQSPETGVEGIAAVAGIVALAGVAVVASRKRK